MKDVSIPQFFFQSLSQLSLPQFFCQSLSQLSLPPTEGQDTGNPHLIKSFCDIIKGLKPESALNHFLLVLIYDTVVTH